MRSHQKPVAFTHKDFDDHLPHLYHNMFLPNIDHFPWVVNYDFSF